MRLNRRKLREKSTDSIRRKFSIDAILRIDNGPIRHIHHFETIPGGSRKPDIHHPRRMVRRNSCERQPKHRLRRSRPAP
jgi:hypothetical protein